MNEKAHIRLYENKNNSNNNNNVNNTRLLSKKNLIIMKASRWLHMERGNKTSHVSQ